MTRFLAYLAFLGGICVVVGYVLRGMGVGEWWALLPFMVGGLVYLQVQVTNKLSNLEKSVESLSDTLVDSLSAAFDRLERLEDRPPESVEK